MQIFRKMEVSFVIIVGVLLKSGNKIIHQTLGRNFHPPPGGVAIEEVVAPLVVGFPDQSSRNAIS